MLASDLYKVNDYIITKTKNLEENIFHTNKLVPKGFTGIKSSTFLEKIMGNEAVDHKMDL